MAAAASTTTPVIQSVQLKGHQAAVSCLDHSSSTTAAVRPSLLLSGSEDGTCRLWDLRLGRAVSCIKCSNSGEEVLSVAFGPPSFLGTTASESPFARDCSVYASVQNRVYGYDLRQASSPIVSEPCVDLTSLLGAPDEVNQIAFSPVRAAAASSITNGGGGGSNHKKGNRKKSQTSSISNSHAPIHLAAVDDGGTVRVTADWALSGGRQEAGFTTRANKRVFCHGVDAMVTSLAFAPRNNNKQQLLASGGTDCCIQIWDVQQHKNETPVASIVIPNSDAGANQVCNPPMVHSLDYSPSGRLLAAGLGDGSVVVVAGQVVTARLEDAHAGSVASCLFPTWKDERNSAITSHDRLLCSIGNDGCVVLWDLGRTVSGDKATDPAELLQLTTETSDSVQERMQSMHLLEDDGEMDKPKTLFAFQHAAGKPNWMVSGKEHDPVFPSSLFVADTTNDISVYTIPMQ